MVVGGAFGAYQITDSFSHERTDDAQVESNMNPIIPRVSGYIEKVYVFLALPLYSPLRNGTPKMEDCEVGNGVLTIEVREEVTHSQSLQSICSIRPPSRMHSKNSGAVLCIAEFSPILF